jgi:hypothetical protein
MEEKGIGEKMFLIVLEREGDYNHILKGGPWTYMNCWNYALEAIIKMLLL